MILPSNQTQAEREKDCFHHCISNAQTKFEQGKFQEAKAYLENANRSLDELHRLKIDSLTKDLLGQLVDTYA